MISKSWREVFGWCIVKLFGPFQDVDVMRAKCIRLLTEHPKSWWKEPYINSAVTILPFSLAHLWSFAMAANGTIRLQLASVSFYPFILSSFSRKLDVICCLKKVRPVNPRWSWESTTNRWRWRQLKSPFCAPVTQLSCDAPPKAAIPFLR